MTTRARINREALASAQLEFEIGWLYGRPPGSHVLLREELAPMANPIGKRVEEILRRPELVTFLSILEEHSRRERLDDPRRRTPYKTRLRLAPHLFQVLESVRARDETRHRVPVLDRPAAEVREHLQNVSARCKTLADLIRKGPQPHVALAGETSANEALRLFAPWTELFEASDESERQVVSFTTLLDRSAAWFDALAERVPPRAKQNRRPALTAAEAQAADLKSQAAEFLVGVFRRSLGQPYYAHVATIAQIVSGLVTDEEFVKKVDTRRTEPSNRGTD